jgi:hypothetical protein
MSIIKRVCFSFLAVILVSTPISYAQSIPLNIVGNKAEANIELPGGLAADITLTFDQVIGLTSENMGISAELISVTDFALLNRLPSSLLTSIPSAFPVMITIEPPTDKGLSFSGVVTVDIHTHNLEYTANTPLRLFKAPLGGMFKDITMTTGAGSYRARGTTGKFSQFIITTDLRSPQMVANSKLQNLQTELNNGSSVIEDAVLLLLNNRLLEISALISANNYSAASDRVNEFKRLVEQYSATSIPNIWRSSRDIDNIAGELIAQASSLRYTLRLING